MRCMHQCVCALPHVAARVHRPGRLPSAQAPVLRDAPASRACAGRALCRSRPCRCITHTLYTCVPAARARRQGGGGDCQDHAPWPAQVLVQQVRIIGPHAHLPFQRWPVRRPRTCVQEETDASLVRGAQRSRACSATEVRGALLPLPFPRRIPDLRAVLWAGRLAGRDQGHVSAAFAFLLSLRA